MILNFQEFRSQRIFESEKQTQRLGKATFDGKSFHMVLFTKHDGKWHLSIEVGDTRNGIKGLYVGSIEVEVTDDFRIGNINTSNCYATFNYRKDMRKFLQGILDKKTTKPQ